MKYPESTKLIQKEINSLYRSCEMIKDEIYSLDREYKETLKKLNALCKESGLSSEFVC